MKKLIINSIMVVIITPLILLASYSFAYEVLIIKSEVEEMKETTNFNVDGMYTKTKIINKILCDGCYQEKEKVTPYLLKDINTKANLCDDCLEVFNEIEKVDK